MPPVLAVVHVRGEQPDGGLADSLRPASPTESQCTWQRRQLLARPREPLARQQPVSHQPRFRPGRGDPAKKAAYASLASTATDGCAELYRPSVRSRLGPDNQNSSPVSTS